jgi:hypothetical protein
MRTSLTLFAALASIAGLSLHPAGAATVQLVAGAGFADATPATPEGGNSGTTLGEQRTILFNAAAQAWGAALGSSQTIKISAQFSALTCGPSSGVLGSAGATNFLALSDGTNTRWYPIALAEALLGTNENDTSAEISANFNSTIDLNDTNCLGTTRWYYGLVGPAPAGTIALYPTVLHEIGHGLGFAAFLCRTPGGCGATPQGAFFSGIPDVWADFLRDNNVDGAGTNEYWATMTNAERLTSFTHDPLLVWDGPAVTARLAAFGQDAGELNESRMRMYAPASFTPGSSISHFHEDANPNLLMEPIADADVFRQTDLTDCLFMDIGWTNSRCNDTAPTLNAIANPAAINEDAGLQTVNLGGITDGSGNTQSLSIAAVSGNLALIPNPAVNYTSPNTTGSVSYTPLLNQSGTALVLVTVTDSAGSSLPRTFTVTVNPVNDPPTGTNLSAGETYTEDTPLNLTDIVTGDVDHANVNVTLTLSNASAGSLNTATSGAVTSTYNAGTGVWNANGAIANVNVLLVGLTFTPANNFNANFTIATSVSDGVAAPVTGSKTMTGIAVNDPPSATNLSASQSYTEDTTLNLTDIVVTDIDSANVTATLTLSDTAAGSLTTATSGAVTSTFNAGTGVWSASGATANVNTLLAGVSYVPAANYSSNFSIATSVSDGVAAPVTGSKAMTGTPGNDPPNATNLSAAETYTEDTPLNLVDIVVSDPDGGLVTATLTLSSPAVGSFNTATSGAVTSTFNAGTGVWSAGGAIADVNTLLAGLTFTPAGNANGNFTIATSVTDSVAAPVTGSKSVTGTAVNDPPNATNLSAAQTYTEDTPLDLTDIVVSDIDSANVTATLTLSDIAAGSLTTATSGAVTSTYTAGTGVWSASGALANVNTLLAGVSYVPANNYSSNFAIATSVSDGVAAALSGSKAMTGTPGNDPPNATNLSAAETYTEDTPLNLVDIVVSDPDGGLTTATLTLSSPTVGSFNTATAGATTSTFNAGTGVWSAAGTIADVNTLLAGLVFTPATHANGNFTVATSVTDSVAAPVTGTKAFTGTPVNDAPGATNLSAAQTYTEDTTLDLTDIVVTDIDSASVTVTLTLSNAAAGSLTTATSGAVTSTYTAGTGVWSASGALANVNTLLAGVSYVPATNHNSGFSIATSVSDGVAAPLTGSKAMTGTAVNDAPNATNLSAGQSYTEDTPLNLTDIVVSDVDSASVTATLTLSDTGAGSLGTATSGAVTSTFSAVTGVWSASGAIADVNVLLAGVTFTPATHYNASFSIATSVGDGVAPALTGSKALTGTPVNDAPTASNLSAPQVYLEDTPLDLVDIVVADVDHATLSVTLTLSDPAAGSLDTATSGAVTSTYTAGTGVWNASGAIADVNVLLANLTYVPATDYGAAFTIATQVSDGVAAPLPGSKAMTGTASNDPPLATNLSAAESYVEDQPADLIDIVVTDTDSPNVEARLTLSNPLAGALSTATAGASTSTYVALTGVWTAAGTPADVTALLAGVQFQPATDFAAGFSIATRVSDGLNLPLTGSKTVTATSINDAPTLGAIADPAAILEDAGQQLLNLTGIGAGGGEIQGLTVDAISGTPALIADPAVTYLSPAAVGSLAYTPAANASGSATITVSVTDSGGTANGGVDTVLRQFVVAVTPVNDAPTLDAIADPANLPVNAPQQTIPLTGIGAGPLEAGQVLGVTAVSDNPALVPNPSVTYSSPAATGQLSFQPVPGAFGSATITVTLSDDGGTANGGVATVQRSFTVTVAASGPLIFRNGFE